MMRHVPQAFNLNCVRKYFCRAAGAESSHCGCARSLLREACRSGGLELLRDPAVYVRSPDDGPCRRFGGGMSIPIPPETLLEFKKTMFRTALLNCLLLLTGLVSSGAAFAGADPTMHQVYQAAEAGNFSEAQAMMDQVLRDHPNSGKAHYVEAQLLAKQGRIARAAAELDTAQRLAPGLPFASSDAVRSLQRRIASSPAATQRVPGSYGAQPGSGFPTGLLLVGIALIAALVFFVRAMSRRNAAAYGTGFGPGGAMQPYGTGVVPGSVGGGIGSGIVGGLATGAALGAGMAAGDALVHHFTDGGQAQAGQMFPAASTDWDTPQDDMGGSDFGISDNSSWDDNSGGGDWN
jgi:uncharacterized protein